MEFRFLISHDVTEVIDLSALVFFKGWGWKGGKLLIQYAVEIFYCCQIRALTGQRNGKVIKTVIAWAFFANIDHCPVGQGKYVGR